MKRHETVRWSMKLLLLSACLGVTWTQPAWGQAPKERHTLATKGLVTAVAFSPDGKRLASCSEKHLMLWDVASGKNTASLEVQTRWLRALAFSPDGKTVAVSGAVFEATRRPTATVELWDVKAGKKGTTLKDEARGASCLAFSPDGKTLAAGCSDETVRLWDAATGENVKVLRGHSGAVRSVAFSPDGKTLAAGSSAFSLARSGPRTTKDRIKLWDVASGKNTASFEADASLIVSVAFSPDGKTLASNGSWGIDLWDVVEGVRAGIIQKPGTSITIKALTFSPDGKTLISASDFDAKVQLWDVASEKLITTLGEGGRTPISSIAFSPDGKTLAVGSANKIKLWEMPADEQKK